MPIVNDFQPVELALENGGRLIVDADHAEKLREVGVLVLVDGRPHVVGKDGKMKTVLSALGLKGWKPKDDDWTDLRSDRLVKPARGHGKTQVEGVSFKASRQKYVAQVGKKYLGIFDTEQEAKEAREAFVRNIVAP